ncbi:MAG TPA: OmpH family outer membrane protein [Verrucomicrobiae bacterium]|jgi:Skp family chaperone for outer membrane proteins
MRNFLRTVFATILLLAFSNVPALAQGKIGTVDLRKLFDGYYKTKLAQANIQEKAAQLDKDDKGMRDEQQKASKEYQDLLAQANDQAISADERDKRKQAAADKLKQMQDGQATIDQYERQAQATLSDQRQRMRTDILKEIDAVITAKAKASGCTLVIDTAAETINQTPTVIYSSGENDLTADVLAQLNAGAPIDLTKPAASATEPPPLANP